MAGIFLTILSFSSPELPHTRLVENLVTSAALSSSVALLVLNPLARNHQCQVLAVALTPVESLQNALASPNEFDRRASLPAISCSSDTVLPFLHYGGRPIFLPARNLHTLLNMRDRVTARCRPEDDI